jgi:hypothetical protein
MGLRNWIMGRLLRAHAKLPKEPDSIKTGDYILTGAARVTLLLDGIRLIGSGNGAGALAAVAAYWSRTRLVAYAQHSSVTETRK